MKTILEVKLTDTFYAHAATHNAENETELSIHEFFRDHFAYKNFKTCNIQQDGRTGVYTLQVEPSSKDAHPMQTLIEQFVSALAQDGVNVYIHTKTRVITIWFDEDELEYYANLNNGPVPDAMATSYDAIIQWVNGYKIAMQEMGASVYINDTTEEA